MDKSTLGYDKPLFILPFDHRSTFYKNMPGMTDGEIKQDKQIIYAGFEAAVSRGIPKDQAAILVDEQFGDQIIRDASQKGYTVIYTTEKSGQDEFDFEYGDKFGEHIEKYQPQIVKALLRYNPAGDEDLNRRQRARLKILSDYCHEHGYKFLIEPLIPATEAQLKTVVGSQESYDKEVRPGLMVDMITELQTDGVEPDIWKIEGLSSREQYQKVIAQARSGGRDKVSAVVLGRAASAEQVEKWLAAGKGAIGIIGFAIGRTIFWDELERLREKKISKEEAEKNIALNYKHFYDFFIS